MAGPSCWPRNSTPPACTSTAQHSSCSVALEELEQARQAVPPYSTCSVLHVLHVGLAAQAKVCAVLLVQLAQPRPGAVHLWCSSKRGVWGGAAAGRSCHHLACMQWRAAQLSGCAQQAHNHADLDVAAVLLLVTLQRYAVNAQHCMQGPIGRVTRRQLAAEPCQPPQQQQAVRCAQ